MVETGSPALAGESGSREEVRARIVAAATELLREGGRDAVTTRAVALAAGVQAPTLYRLFGDKRGLLDAVAFHGFAEYLGDKTTRPPGEDPVEDLRRGWDRHVGFGLARPAVYALIYGDPGANSRAAEAGREVLRAHIHRVALAGRLRVAEARAVELFHAGGCGTVFALLASPPEDRDPGLSDAAREAALAAILTSPASPDESGPVAAAITLRAALPGATRLTAGERHVLGEWLDRLVADAN